MESTLEFAEVRSFSGRGGDIAGLLQWVRPDAVIVDDDRNAVDAAAYAEQSETPLLHIAVRDRELRVFHRGGWHHVGNGEGPTPEAIRNVVAGALFARDGAR